MENVLEAMKKIIWKSTWMDNKTKYLATEKLDAITRVVGGINNYSDADIDDYYSEVNKVYLTVVNSFYCNSILS